MGTMPFGHGVHSGMKGGSRILPMPHHSCILMCILRLPPLCFLFQKLREVQTWPIHTLKSNAFNFIQFSTNAGQESRPGYLWILLFAVESPLLGILTGPNSPVFGYKPAVVLLNKLGGTLNKRLVCVMCVCC